jgi:two-component system response regulator HydG
VEQQGKNGHTGVAMYIKYMMTKSKILLVEDDLDLREALTAFFQDKNYEVVGYSDAIAAVHSFLKSEDKLDVDLILSDLRLPGMNGLDFIIEAQKYLPDVPILLMTAHQSLEDAVEAIRRGAYDFVTKPLNLQQLELSVARALKLRSIQRENSTLKNVLKPEGSFHGVIGKSPSMVKVFQIVEKIAPSAATVLISGESGTGKEVMARLIHRISPRAKNNFVAINCSAIPESLLESELFGHAKGAFTGASDKKRGLFEEAEAGTLFLDEIGDMPPPLQAKLLRALQERVIRRVGENKDIPVDVRVIAATHKNLAKDVENKNFRQDLYFRLNVIPLNIPPLRDRVEDVLPLSQFFLDKIAFKYNAKKKTISKELLDFLSKQNWPGNVRELENLLERAFILGKEETTLSLEDFTMLANPAAQRSNVDSSSSDDHFEENEFHFDNQQRSLDEVANAYVHFVYHQVGKVKERAAQVLQIDRKTLSRRLKEHEESLAGKIPTPAMRPDENIPLRS